MQIPKRAKDRQFAPLNHSTYEYYRKNTYQYGDYFAFRHGKINHLKSEFVADIESFAYFFKNELGLNKGDCFSIFMPTNVESLILFLALNKIGVIVNFIHPLLPSENFAEIVKFTKSKGVAILDMFVPTYVDTIAALKLPVLCCVPATYALPDKYAAQASDVALAALHDKIDKFLIYADVLKKYQDKTLGHIVGSRDDVALYMNGGGTTGKSRTIKLTNEALCNVIHMQGHIAYAAEEIGVDTELCCMPFFHAFGLCAGALSLINKGCKAIFMPKFDVDTFVAHFDENKICEFNGVPNMFHKLLEHPDFDGPHLKSVRVMYCGGDDLSPEFLDEFNAVMRKNGSQAEICQGYGLTECCAVDVVNPPWDNNIRSIGRPLPGLTIEIWDEEHNKVPVGEIGEIVMHGPTMMQGYLTENGPIDEGLFEDRNGIKWVLTGDLGKYDEDGYLYFVGRKKRVIIISGYNVYPRDIEKLVAKLDFVVECCAVQGYDENKKSIVRLYVVANDGDREEQKKEIRDLCAKYLNKFSIPKEIEYIDALPRTRVQKVDFLALTQAKPE